MAVHYSSLLTRCTSVWNRIWHSIAIQVIPNQWRILWGRGDRLLPIIFRNTDICRARLPNPSLKIDHGLWRQPVDITNAAAASQRLNRCKLHSTLLYWQTCTCYTCQNINVTWLKINFIESGKTVAFQHCKNDIFPLWAQPWWASHKTVGWVESSSFNVYKPEAWLPFPSQWTAKSPLTLSALWL